MGTVFKYVFLVLLFTAFGWKIYREYLAPEPETVSQESRKTGLAVGDPEERITDFYGMTGVARTRNGIKTIFFTDTEIDVMDGRVSDIRNLASPKGTLKSGGQTFSIDDSSTIERQ